MNALEMTEKVQDGFLKVVETTQGWTLGAMRSTSGAFDTFKPDTSRIPFADKLLSAQHAFISSMVEITMPEETTTVVAKKS